MFQGYFRRRAGAHERIEDDAALGAAGKNAGGDELLGKSRKMCATERTDAHRPYIALVFITGVSVSVFAFGSVELFRHSRVFFASISCRKYIFTVFRTINSRLPHRLVVEIIRFRFR